MINWSAIDTVLLDMDGTLLDLAFDNYFWQTHVPMQYAKKAGISNAEGFAKVAQWTNAHYGTLNWYSLAFWSKELDMDLATLKYDLAHQVALRPGAEDFLQALNDAGKQVVLVTNADPLALDIKMEATGLEPYFHDLISSHTHGAAKESASFWPSLRQQMSFDNPSTLFVDDNLHVLQTAEDFGIAHLASIRQPDSGLPARPDTQPYFGIRHFNEIMP